MHENTSYVVTPTDLGELSDIRYTFAIARSAAAEPSARDNEFLIIRFVGEYGGGSAGNSDATLMRAAVHLGRQAFDPTGIVLDLRDLDYYWGDMIADVLNEAIVDNVRPSVVVSDSCRDGMTSLISVELFSDPADWLFDSQEQALRAVTANHCLVEDAYDLAAPHRAGDGLPRLQPIMDPTTNLDRHEAFRECVWAYRRQSAQDNFPVDRALLLAAGSIVAPHNNESELWHRARWFLSRYELHGLDTFLDALADVTSDNLAQDLENLPTPLLTLFLDQLAGRPVEAEASSQGRTIRLAQRLLATALRRRQERLSGDFSTDR